MSNIIEEGRITEPLLAGDGVETKKPRRIIALDLMRGFIMVVMAWDHTKDILGDTTMLGSEDWQGEGPDFRNNIGFFIARIVSDICAPGFFFTMGMGMTMFTFSRLQKNWNFRNIIGNFCERSFVIFMVERLINYGFIMPLILALLLGNTVNDMPGFEGNLTRSDVPRFLLLVPISFMYVMTGLALSMLFGAVFVLIPMVKLNKMQAEARSTINYAQILGWVLFFVSFIVSNTLITHYQYGDPKIVRHEFPAYTAPATTFWQYVIRIFLIPGVGQGISRFGYPMVPWVGLTCLGMGFGFQAQNDFETLAVKFKKLSAIFGISFFIVRMFFGPYGNLRGYPRGDGSGDDVNKVSIVIEFFYTEKYPPSLAYALWTMAVNFVLIAAFSDPEYEKIIFEVKTPEQTSNLSFYQRSKHAFVVSLHKIGTVPLFFYIAHIFLIAIFGIFLSIIFGNSGVFKVKSLLLMLPFWVMVVVLLIPVCERYGLFKSKTSYNSWWRML